MRIIAQHFPNRELRLSIVPERPLQRLGDDAIPAIAHGPDAPLTLPPNSEPAPSEPPALGGLRPGFGGLPAPTRFGNNARRTLSRSAGVFDRDGIPNDHLVFLTGTLPGSRRESFEAMQRWSSYAVDLLKSKLSKVCDPEPYSMYVWELQKRGALHIHYCQRIANPNQRQFVLDNWKKIWTQIVDAVGEKAGIDMWLRGPGALPASWKDQKEIIQADAQLVEKSVGSYLAKYLSKDSNVCNLNPARFKGPVRWWGVSRPLLARMKELSGKLVVEGFGHQKIRHIREQILAILDGMEGKVHRYFDKAKTSEVMISYGESCCEVFRSIARLLRPTFVGFGVEDETEGFVLLDTAGGRGPIEGPAGLLREILGGGEGGAGGDSQVEVLWSQLDLFVSDFGRGFLPRMGHAFAS